MATFETAAPPRESERRARKASRETRRLQLIEATIDSLAKRGYADTTLADVADGAGLSRGIVNFHFESKDKLLVATLQHLNDEYAAHWHGAISQAGNDPAERLAALVTADFDKQVCNRRKLAAWGAFWGEARSRPTYHALCSTRDEDYQNMLTGLCAALIEEGGYRLDPRQTAIALEALLEGSWLRLLLAGEATTREKGLSAARAMLGALFPAHFSMDGEVLRRK